MALRLRRGLDADRTSFTPESGELIYVTDTKKLYVGDGVTAGGVPVDTTLGEVFLEELANVVTDSTGPASDGSILAYDSASGDWNAVDPNVLEIDVVNDLTPQLGGNLDLNSYDITGTGDIDITGSIVASGSITANGNIVLGDSGTDSISVGAEFQSSLVPDTDSAYELGNNTKRWANLYVNGIVADGHIEATSINSIVVADDSSVIIDPNGGGSITAVSADITNTITATTLDVDTILTGTITGDLIGSVVGEDSTVFVVTMNGTLTNGGLKIVEDAISPVDTGVNIIRIEGASGGPTTVQFDSTGGSGSSPIEIIHDTGTMPLQPKLTFKGIKGGASSPVITTGGEYLGAISYQAYDPNTADYVVSGLFGMRVDPSRTPGVDQASGMFEVVTNAGTNSALDLKYMVFDSFGRLGINTQAPSTDTTLDVNGIARLAPQSSAPATLVEGMIAIADGVNWDPAGKAGAVSYPVYYDSNAWNAFY